MEVELALQWLWKAHFKILHVVQCYFRRHSVYQVDFNIYTLIHSLCHVLVMPLLFPSTPVLFLGRSWKPVNKVSQIDLQYYDNFIQSVCCFDPVVFTKQNTKQANLSNAYIFHPFCKRNPRFKVYIIWLFVVLSKC